MNTNPTIKEGPEGGFAVVLVEFEPLGAANSFYHSDDYTAEKAIRLLAAEADLLIAEDLQFTPGRLPHHDTSGGSQ